jgi:hypothetical protein
MERINIKRDEETPDFCWWIVVTCPSDGGVCAIDVPDCPNECAILNLCLSE